MLHLAQVVASNLLSPFEWGSEHLHLIGWPTLVYLAWKVGSTFTALKNSVVKTVDQIDQMATNHFPHMESSLAKQDTLLENMDKNLQRMADREL
jgi:hypothetical protein